MTNNRKLLADIMQFLQENGWSRHLSTDKKLIRFQTDRDLNKPVSIYLTAPQADTQPNASELDEALTTIRQYYGLPFQEIRHRSLTLANAQGKVGALPRDLVTTRVPDERVRDDTIDVMTAFATIGYLRTLVEGAASAEIALIDSASSAANRIAREYAQDCRFGHTFRGSFGFQIECPLTETAQLTLDLFEAEKPLGRKVSERICLGLSSLSEAVEKENSGPILSQSGGLTSRMCSDLADFLERNEMSSIFFGVEYDRSVLSPAIVANDFCLRGAYVPLLREASKALEPPPQERAANIIGRVIILKASGIPLSVDDLSRRFVTVQWESDEGRRNVQVELGPNQYADAIRAHQGGHHVQIKGTLIQRGTKLSLSEPSSLTILE